MRRRIWWCVYGLDRVLSIALGRPPGAHDDDCNIDLRRSSANNILHYLTLAITAEELDDAQLIDFCEGKSVVPTSKSWMTGFVA